jgi:hypothetical protein
MAHRVAQSNSYLWRHSTRSGPGNGTSSRRSVTIRRLLLAVGVTAGGLVGPVALAGPAGASTVGEALGTFNTSGETTITVPTDVDALTIVSNGQTGLHNGTGGGSMGGQGASITATLPVSPGDSLQVYVGVGGGAGGGPGSAGGGESSVVDGTASSLLIVAGGGGGQRRWATPREGEAEVAPEGSGGLAAPAAPVIPTHCPTRVRLGRRPAVEREATPWSAGSLAGAEDPVRGEARAGLAASATLANPAPWALAAPRRVTAGAAAVVVGTTAGEPAGASTPLTVAAGAAARLSYKEVARRLPRPPTPAARRR